MKSVFIALFALTLGGPVLAEGIDAPEVSNKVFGPDVQLTADWKIVAKAASYHQPLAMTMEIKEADNCDYRKISDSQIQIGGRCAYLSGAYRYVFQPEGSATQRQMIVGFTASKSSGDSRIFMVSQPMVLLQK